VNELCADRKGRAATGRDVLASIRCVQSERMVRRCVQKQGHREEKGSKGTGSNGEGSKGKGRVGVGQRRVRLRQRVGAQRNMKHKNKHIR